MVTPIVTCGLRLAAQGSQSGYSSALELRHPAYALALQPRSDRPRGDRSSSPVSTFVILGKDSFRYTRGKPVAYASSPGIERTHCGRCGSPIAYENKDEFALYACTLDDATGLKPEYHSWFAEKMPWLEIADALPRHQRSSRDAQEEATEELGDRT